MKYVVAKIDPRNERIIKHLTLEGTYKESEDKVKELNKKLKPTELAVGMYYKIITINQ